MHLEHTQYFYMEIRLKINKYTFLQFCYKQCCNLLCLTILFCTTSCPSVWAKSILNESDHASTNQYALVKEKASLGPRTQVETSIPQTIEFNRINPTKYRVELHHVHDNFNLVFNERFDKQWKAYFVPKKALDLGSNKLCADQKKFNEQSKIISSSIDSESNQNFSIENEKLNSTYIWETWFPNSLIEKDSNKIESSTNYKQFIGRNKVGLSDYLGFNAIEWPESFHHVSNTFANGWMFDLNAICTLPSANNNSLGYYVENADDTIDIDLVLEYKPQRYVYLAYMLSAASILFTLVLLVLLRKTV